MVIGRWCTGETSFTSDGDGLHQAVLIQRLQTPVGFLTAVIQYILSAWHLVFTIHPWRIFSKDKDHQIQPSTYHHHFPTKPCPLVQHLNAYWTPSGMVDSTIPLGSPFQCLSTLTEKFFLIPNLNVPWCNLTPFPLFLSLLPAGKGWLPSH